MEVDKIKHVAHIYIVKCNEQRVILALRGSAVDGKHLVVVTNREAIYLKFVLAVNYRRGCYVPCSIANCSA